MALTYTKFSCPNCHKVISSHLGSEKITGYGSKLQICPYCCRTYFDRSKIEIELDGALFADTATIKPITVFGLCVGLFGILSSFLDPFILVLSAPWFIGSLYLCICDVKTYRERQALLKAEAVASRQRLYDLDYLSFLVANRVKVPQKYFDEACKYLEDHPDP